MFSRFSTQLLCVLMFCYSFQFLQGSFQDAKGLCVENGTITRLELEPHVVTLVLKNACIRELSCDSSAQIVRVISDLGSSIGVLVCNGQELKLQNEGLAKNDVGSDLVWFKRYGLPNSEVQKMLVIECSS